MKKIRVLSFRFKNYPDNEETVKTLLERNLINSFFDVVLIETPIEEKRYWTDVFMRSPEICAKLKEAIEERGIQVLALMPNEFLGWISEDLVCFSTISKARKIKQIIEES